MILAFTSWDGSPLDILATEIVAVTLSEDSANTLLYLRGTDEPFAVKQSYRDTTTRWKDALSYRWAPLA